MVETVDAKSSIWDKCLLWWQSQGGGLDEFARAAVTKCCRPGGYKLQKFVISQYWRLEVHDQGVGGVGFSPRPLSLVEMIDDHLLMCPQVAFPLCTHILGVFVSTRSLLYGHPPDWIRAHPNCALGSVTNYLFEGPLSQYSHALRYWGLELPHMNGGGVGWMHFSL